MAGYIGTQAVSVNTTSATISDDLVVGDDATITGDLDVDGTSNLDVVDIDGAVDMASTLQVDGAITSNGLLTVDGSANSSQAIFTGTSGRGLEISTFSVGAADEGVKLDATASGSTGEIALATNGSIKATVKGSGELLVGKTVATLATNGSALSSGALTLTTGSTSTNQGTANGASLLLVNPTATDNNFSHIGGYNSNSLVTSQINFVNTSHSGRLGAITFRTHSGSALVEHMRIEDDGNTHIGQNFVATNTYRFRITNTIDQTNQLNFNSSGSLTADLHAWDTSRANTTDFNFWRCRTSVAGTPDDELILQGTGALIIEGAITQNGADYAEYFEWADGNGSSEDRIGISVKLDGAKIVPSTSSDNTATIIGVVSGNAGVLGDAAYIKWQGKFLKDDYGRVIRETYTNTEWTVEEFEHSYQTDYIPSDLTVPSDAVVVSRDNNNNLLTRKKVNPNWDATANYIPRAERKEWDAIGIMGKLRINKGQRTGTNWIKLRDVSDTVEEWLVR